MLSEGGGVRSGGVRRTVRGGGRGRRGRGGGRGGRRGWRGGTWGGTGTWRGRKTEGTPSLGHESSRLPTTRAPCPRHPPSSPRHPKHTHTHIHTGDVARGRGEGCRGAGGLTGQPPLSPLRGRTRTIRLRTPQATGPPPGADSRMRADGARCAHAEPRARGCARGFVRACASARMCDGRALSRPCACVHVRRRVAPLARRRREASLASTCQVGKCARVCARACASRRHVSAWPSVCVCVAPLAVSLCGRVCVARARARMRVCVCGRARVRACVFVCVARARARMRVCVCVGARARVCRLESVVHVHGAVGVAEEDAAVHRRPARPLQVQPLHPPRRHPPSPPRHPRPRLLHLVGQQPMELAGLLAQ